MFRKYKQLAIGVVIGSLVSSVGITTATGNYVTTQVVDYIKFKFDGVEKHVPDGYTVLMYQNRTYVPARFIAEQLGAQVDWDNANQAVVLHTIKGTSMNASSYPVDVNISSGPMKMKITKVTLDPSFKKRYLDPINVVILTVEVENTSTGIVRWLPDQGTIVLNTKEQAEGTKSIFYSDDISGEFIGNVIKKGNIVFQVNSNLDDIRSFNYKINAPFDTNLNSISTDTLTPISIR